MRGINISVIASGLIPPGQAMKFFFYGKQSDVGEVWFLMEMIVTPGQSAGYTLKADGASPGAVASFNQLVWSALGSFVQ